ncbi:MAG: hypothetical protein PHI97_29570 [Desulfobulbus sp.]|nr:hypothetical protein [Desulfobulbus sp.]
MQHISGLIPLEQEVVRPEPYPYVYRPLPTAGQRSLSKGLLACLLLTLAFVLLVWAGGMSHVNLAAMKPQRLAVSVLDVPIATAAAIVGYSPVEAVQLLWDNGINVTDSAQTLNEIAKNNGRTSNDILALFSDDGRYPQTMINSDGFEKLQESKACLAPWLKST